MRGRLRSGGALRALAAIIVVLSACTGDPPAPPPPDPVPVVAPAPESKFSFSRAVPLDIDPAHAETLAGSPALAASYEASLEALREEAPARDRVARVAALRAKARAEVPAEDASAVALLEAYDEALTEAMGELFMGLAQRIIASDRSADEKLESIEMLEAELLKSEWDFSLSSRDMVQAKLMVALRTIH